MQALKHPEHPLGVLRRYPDPIVLHHEVPRWPSGRAATRTSGVTGNICDRIQAKIPNTKTMANRMLCLRSRGLGFGRADMSRAMSAMLNNPRLRMPPHALDGHRAPFSLGRMAPLSLEQSEELTEGLRPPGLICEQHVSNQPCGSNHERPRSTWTFSGRGERSWISPSGLPGMLLNCKPSARSALHVDWVR